MILIYFKKNKQVSLFGPAHRSAQAGSRPGQCLRRPAHRPVQAGARPGHCPSQPAPRPAQAGSTAGRASARGRSKPRPARRATATTAVSDGERERGSGRRSKGCGAHPSCVWELDGGGGGRRRPNQARRGSAVVEEGEDAGVGSGLPGPIPWAGRKRTARRS